ncbi:flagellar hook-associated protein 3 [Terracidiphilus sp.]|jgi:flagellar hook-associated protein 3 FlgL|uniref:flagellin N-terminal helical domain-containing protein n=1 Tax=Terracidiphilus sp. TaxID=1964191 RepID=UPI003C1CB033
MRVDPSYINNLVSALDTAQGNEQQFSSELSSGVSVTSLSSNPVAAGENVLLLNQIQQDDSYSSTTSQVTGQLQVADSALGSVVTQLTQAISLATSANNGTMNTSEVNSVGSQLQGILGEVIQMANTSYQGQFIFAGTATSTQPFDSSGNYTVTAAEGGQTVNFLTTPSNQKIQLNVPGSQIFTGNGNSSVSVMGALNALITDYSGATVDEAQAAADTSTLNSALNFVSEQRVTIDNSINQVSASSTAATSEALQLTSAQTNLMQADVGQVSTQLSTAETQATALEDTIAQLGSGSLFDKLQY